MPNALAGPAFGIWHLASGVWRLEQQNIRYDTIYIHLHPFLKAGQTDSCVATKSSTAYLMRIRNPRPIVIHRIASQHRITSYHITTPRITIIVRIGIRTHTKRNQGAIRYSNNRRHCTLICQTSEPKKRRRLLVCLCIFLSQDNHNTQTKPNQAEERFELPKKERKK
ncbi:hypothetical protein F5X97DRAFT_190112 [Nemania serpens]|nr:hypothetical protein F5X97DRAFT_190112 [Nemania serpens]